MSTARVARSVKLDPEIDARLTALAERTRLSAAPFVEGLLGAYGAAGIGKDLQAVAAEADGAAEAKRSQVAAF